MKQRYSGKQTLLIDLANHYGLDKKVFDDRLAFGRSMLPAIQACKTLDDVATLCKTERPKMDEPELASMAILAIWDALAGRESGHVVEIDAVNSGCQILSLLTKCETGMKNTGTIDTGTRPDLYQLIVDNMGLDVERKRVKMAVVPFIYGSEVIPQNVFPDHYDQFVQGYQDTVPGAAWAKDILVNAWNPRATEYNLIAPDGGHCKITVVVDKQIIGKYGQHSYTYSFKERGTKNPKENGTKALAAHTTHIMDAFVLREVGRRTNYDMMTVLAAKHALECSLMYGDANIPSDDLQRLVSLAERHNCVSVRSIDYIELGHLQGVPEWYVKELIAILHKMLSHAPFETRDIHDGYGSLANNTWYVQGHYNHVCAQLYKSTWLYNTIADLTGVQHPAPQWKQSVYDQVMNATYALC